MGIMGTPGSLLFVELEPGMIGPTRKIHESTIPQQCTPSLHQHVSFVAGGHDALVSVSSLVMRLMGMLAL